MDAFKPAMSGVIIGKECNGKSGRRLVKGKILALCSGRIRAQILVKPISSMMIYVTERNETYESGHTLSPNQIRSSPPH